MWFGFRSDLDVPVLGGIAVGFHCQDIFIKSNVVELEQALCIRLDRGMMIAQCGSEAAP